MVIPSIMADVEEVEVVVAHSERATLRVGNVFLKVDADQTRTDVEVEAMALAPIPTPEILWRKPPVLALAALAGTALGRLGEPSTASSAAWAAALPGGVDVLLDCAGGQTRDEAIGAVREFGRAYFIVLQSSPPHLERGITGDSFAAHGGRQRLELFGGDNRVVAPVTCCG